MLLLGGLTESGKPRSVLYVSAQDFAPQVASSGTMAAGVVSYAIYLLHRFFRQDLPVHCLRRLAEFLINETASQDPKVGGPINIATITVAQGLKMLEEGEVGQLNARNLARSDKLRESFYEGDDESA